MDNKELPQEVVIAIKYRAKEPAFEHVLQQTIWERIIDGEMSKGAQIAKSHYEPIITELSAKVISQASQLQAKDTTIKEQAEKIEELNDDYEDAALKAEVLAMQLNKIRDLLKAEVEMNGGIWDNYKEQHGI